jgi:transcription elongation factor GreA
MSTPQQTAAPDPATTNQALWRTAEPPQANITLTAEGEQALRAKLTELRRELDEIYPARLREARSFGGAGGNDDYLQIKEEEALLALRVSRLQAMLDAATVLRSADAEAGVVAVGHRVEVEDRDSGAVSAYDLVGGFERAVNGVSADSPVGRALLGRRVGDRTEVELPGGRLVRLRILGCRPSEA